jgi:hypothetical protein
MILSSFHINVFIIPVSGTYILKYFSVLVLFVQFFQSSQYQFVLHIAAFIMHIR